MKAIQVTAFGGPEVLKVAEVSTPALGDSEVLVRLHAAGVNPVETYIRSGKYAKLPPLPYTPGTDGAGRVEAVGREVSHVEPGQRVYVSGSLSGTYAESCVCQADQVHPLPADISFAQGAALGVPYATAYRALFQRGNLQAGETVLVHGGTGGAGQAAVQFAKCSGARVLATGGSAEGRQMLKDQGVHEDFDHHAADADQQILAATGGEGVDLIVEMLANVNLARDLKLLRPGGRVVIVGSRGTVEIDPRDAMMREADIRGVMLARATAEELAATHRAIVDGLTKGSLQPVVGQQFALENAPAAHEAVMKSGARGKIVLVL